MSKTKRIAKSVLIYLISVALCMILYVIAEPALKTFYASYVSKYGAFTLERLKEVGFSTILDTDYAKYVYFLLADWIISGGLALVSTIKFIKRLHCIFSIKCVECEKYLSCRDKHIRVKRNY